MPDIDSRLIGSWMIDPADVPGIERYGCVTMEFMPDARLLYTIHYRDRKQVFKLTYSTSDGVLTTDQPSTPRLERTLYRFEGDTLVLRYGTSETRFVPVSDPSALEGCV